MQIKSIILQDDGFKGLKVIGLEPVQTENGTLMDEVQRTRRSPVPPEFKTKIKRLKFHFLYLGRFFMPEWLEYLKGDKSDASDDKTKFKESGYRNCIKIFDDTKIVQLSSKSSGIFIKAKVQAVEGKMMDIQIPDITEEDDYPYFDDLVNLVKELFAEANIYLNSKKLKIDSEQGRQLLFNFYKDEQKIEDMIMKHGGIEQAAAKALQSKGWMVADPKDSGIEKVDPDQENLVIEAKDKPEKNNGSKTPLVVFGESPEDILIPATQPIAGSKEGVSKFKEKSLQKQEID